MADGAGGGAAATVTTHTVLSIARSVDDARTSDSSILGASDPLIRRYPSPRQRHPSPSATRDVRASRSRSPPPRGARAARSGAGNGLSGGGHGGAPAGVDLSGVASSWAAWLQPTRLDREVALNALAVAGASMADPLMSLVDTAMVGRIGTAPLAALGSNGALFNCLFFLFFTALAVICTQAMAQAHARGDTAAVGRGFAQALCATAAVSAGLVLLLTAAPEQVLALFATNKEMMRDARTYLEIRALGLPAALFMCVSQAAFRSLLDLRTPLLVVCASNASNYLLDELFMFRLGGGMAGCGWASVLSQYLGAALFVLLIARRRDFGLREALDAAADAALVNSSGGGGGGGGGAWAAGDGGGKWQGASDLELDVKSSGDLSAAADAIGVGVSGHGVNGYEEPLLGADGGGLAGSRAHHRPAAAAAVGGGLLPPGPLKGRYSGKGARRGGARGLTLRRKVVLLLWSLPWRPFLKRFAGLSIRGCLILSTYTSASVVAARAGTAVIAGHQVVQQHQQLQMSVAWSFLHVAQSMVANVYHSPAGPRAARRLASRITLLAGLYSGAAALVTLALRDTLPRVFTRDAQILALVRSAEAPASLMMALSWCNCLEGCLLAMEDSPYVVRTYPFAAGFALLQLASTGLLQPLGPGTLEGIWRGLCLYYLVLLLAFGARCSWRSKKMAL